MQHLGATSANLGEEPMGLGRVHNPGSQTHADGTLCTGKRLLIDILHDRTCQKCLAQVQHF